MAIVDRIKEIEEEIHDTSYNKATQFHIGKLKAKLSMLKEEDLKRKSSGKKGEGFAVKKTGDATAVLVGFPSVGKSTLLNKLTSADSKVAAYEFTTLTVIPGMMEYNGMMIQILDLPGIIAGAASGKGRGREVLSIVRNADLVIILLDATKLKHLSALEKEIYNVGLRIDQHPPRISIQRTDRGGVSVVSSMKLKKIDPKTVREILNVYGIHNAQVALHEDMDIDRFIDGVVKNRIYVPSLVALNKTDLITPQELEKIKKDFSGREIIPISAETGLNLELLKKRIFEKLGVIRVYTRKYGEKKASDEPMIMKKGSTVRDACMGIHKDVIEKFKFAHVSGKSAKFDDQSVGLSHVLQDGDVLTVVTNR
jgi:small GTP-binding protein